MYFTTNPWDLILYPNRNPDHPQNAIDVQLPDRPWLSIHIRDTPYFTFCYGSIGSPYTNLTRPPGHHKHETLVHNAGLMLVHRLRRWSNINPALS